MKRDNITLEWYNEVQDVTNNTTISETDLSDEFVDVDLDKLIKEKSEDVYLHLYEANTVGDDYKKTRALRYMIDKQPRKRHYLMRAINEHIRGAIETGMDREAYEGNGKDWLSPKVKTILKSGGLYIRGPIDIPNFKLEEWENEETKQN